MCWRTNWIGEQSYPVASVSIRALVVLLTGSWRQLWCVLEGVKRTSRDALMNVQRTGGQPQEPPHFPKVAQMIPTWSKQRTRQG